MTYTKILLLAFFSFGMLMVSMAHNPYAYNENRVTKHAGLHRSILFRNPDFPSRGNRRDVEECRTYMGMAIGGGVMLGAGIGLSVGGIELLIHGAAGNYAAGTIIGGYLMAAFGIPMAIAGIPLTIIGAIHAPWSCERIQPQTFVISPSPHGLGLACAF